LVLLGQLELHAKIMNIPNFFDRISFKYTLNPLSKEETKEMIEFRIRQAGYKASTHLFLDEAVEQIYNYTKGYPRKITMLCHMALKELIIKKKFVVDAKLINEIINREIKEGWQIKTPLFQKGNF
jgi:general secretion pathway protein A